LAATYFYPSYSLLLHIGPLPGTTHFTLNGGNRDLQNAGILPQHYVVTQTTKLQFELVVDDDKHLAGYTPFIQEAL
jgi:hypothetical protein